jgi:hypothetical protein
MCDTLSRAKAARIVQTLDIVGMTLCHDLDTNQVPMEIRESSIALLRMIRDQIDKTYNLNIQAIDSVMGDVGKCLTPAEEAELVCEDLQTDLTDE